MYICARINQHGRRRDGLLRTVSLTALIVAGGAPAPLLAAPFRSLAQGLPAPARAPVMAASNAGGAAAMQAAQVGARNLAAAAQKFASMAQVLAQQAAAARQGGGGPANGWLVAGGLQPAPGYQTPGAGIFQNAVAPNLPAGATNVTIVQTAPKAILNWQSFNVGRHTTLTFDQSAGGAAASSWSVLNRIDSPSLSPTAIFGAVHAQGQVWVLNPNGVLFGAGSQVSLHSLVAGAFSTTDAQFLASGLYAPKASASFTAGLGAVTVSPGASIVTDPPASATDGGGSVILLGASAENDGLISTPAGQTILGAGQSFLLRQGYTASSAGGGATTGNTASTVLGSEIEVTHGGPVTNTGLIQASTGDVTLVGHSIVQAGLIGATTAVGQRGTIHLLTPRNDATSSVTLAPASVTAILPDPASGEAPGSAQQAKYVAQAAYGTGGTLLNDQSSLPDQPGYARIEITTGGIAGFGGQSLTLAPGGQIAVTADGRAYAATGAQLDVAGLTGITLPMSANLLTVNIQGAQLADSPQNRDSGLLSSNTVQIDSRTLIEVPGSAADPQNRFYTAGGLLQVTGELSALSSALPQWLTVGGRITLNSPEAVSQPGSVFNIAGGSIAYQGGNVPQTYLIGPQGVLYNLATAPGNLTYSGVYHGDIVNHRRWGIIQTVVNPLLTPATITESGYTEGRDGGSLTLQSSTAVFEGTINAGVQRAAQQNAARPAGVTDPFTLTQQTAPLAGGLTLTGSVKDNPAVAPTDVTIGTGVASVASGLGPDTRLPASLRNTAVFDAGQLAGLGALSIAVGPAATTDDNAGSITLAAPLALADGATASLAAPVVSLNAGITLRGGNLTVQTENPLTQGVFSSTERGTITLAPGAVLDTRGTFDNALLDDTAPDAATLNGGNITLRSTGGLALGAGSLIDASAGAALTVAGRLQGGHGGNVTLVGDDPAFDYSRAPRPGQSLQQPVVLGGIVRSLGVTAGGVFTLDAPSVVIGDAPVPASPNQVALSSAFFGSGFGGYVINGSGPGGVQVLPGTTLTVTQPVLQAGAGTAQAPTGSDPETALVPVLAPTYTLDTVQGSVIQRPGASLSLTSVGGTISASAASNIASLRPGGITIGAGAAITVDPGQNVTLSSPAQIVVDGRITAPSGRISVLNTSANAAYSYGLAGLSVWIGGTATLDASARAVTGTDAQGRAFGLVPQGGSIVIGAPTSADAFENNQGSTDAFIYVRPGAVLEAGGTNAAIDVAAQVGAPRRVQAASAGGTITFSSYNGIYLDGTIAAPAGGAAAAGGTLGIEMDLPALPNPGHPLVPVPQWFFEPRRIVVSTDTRPDLVPADLAPKDGSFVQQSGQAGQAGISQQQIGAGGFDTLFLLARDQIVFDPVDTGGVSLSLGQSATLSAFAFSTAQRTGNVSIAAPFVFLSGVAPLNPAPNAIVPGLNVGGVSANPSTRYQPCLSGASECAAGTFTVSASQIDLSRDVRFGLSGSYATADAADPRQIESAGFDAVDLLSSGDIRFVPPAAGLANSRTATDGTNGLTLAAVSLVTTGDLTLSAARLYPATGVSAVIGAGFVPDPKARQQDPSTAYYTDSTLVIARPTDAPQQRPLSVFGQLQFYGETILQGGNVSAPLGSVAFGLRPLLTPAGLPDTPTPAARIELLDGSTVSVSAAGATIPFGGTTDGLTYAYDGQNFAFTPAIYGAAPAFGPQSIGLAAALVQGDAGSVLDLRGGGTLTGGGGEFLAPGGTSLQSQGFIAGRGGSTDVLYAPLFAISPVGAAVQAQPTLAQDPVYAILPGLQGAYAPTTLLDATASYAGSVPRPGEQVTLGAGVPGLAAGTYTLLPSYYALLPGGYRVQLGATANAAASVAASTFNGSTVAAGTIGVANTAQSAAQPVELTLTPGAVVRTLSQYDEQGYAQTAVASAAVFGKSRPYLPQDAGQIDLQFLLPRRPAAGIPLDFAGTALLAAQPGGYDGAVIVQEGSAPIEILGTAPPTAGEISLPAASLDAFHAPLLLVGGDFTQNLGFTTLNNPGRDGSVTLRSGAALTAGAVWLFGTGSGGVSIEQGATISTAGPTPNLPDSRTGAVFYLADLTTKNSDAAVIVADGTYNLLPGGPGTSTVTLGGCAVAGACTGSTTLASNGFVGVFAGAGVTEASPVAFAAPSLLLGAPSINLTPDGDTGAVPGGITLSQAALTGLLAGSPALQSLDLIAGQSINLFGSLQFGAPGSRLALTLDTPALYGAGAPGDTATISADTIIWTNSGGTNSAGAPAPILPGGPGTGDGALVLEARQIVIGYGALSQPQDQTNVARIATGFSGVTLIGAEQVTGNNHASFSVYQSQDLYGAPGSGGALSIETPLLTTAPGGILAFTAGSSVTVAGSAGASAPVAGGLGGEIDISAPTIGLSTRIALPSGRLALDATGDITLAATSLIDLTGPAVTYFDVTRGSWGGTVQLEATAGSIVQQAGGVIDVAAQMAQGGTLSATALAGTVALDGTLLGGAPAGYAGGSIDLRGQSLAGSAGALSDPAAFASFNAALNAGGFTLARGFELAGPGSLTLPQGATIQAQTTAIAVDRGSLDIEGTIDASGPSPGTIRLAGAGGLTLGGTSVLDAHGAVEQCAAGPCADYAGPSQNQPVDALNAASVELIVPASVSADGLHFTPNTAELTIAPGATIDIASADPTADARVEIDVPRIVAGSGAGSGDANISAAGPVRIVGATRYSSIDVNAFWAYAPDNAPFLAGGILTQAAFGSAGTPGPVTADANAFIGAALAQGLVTGKLAGLSAYTDAFHLRPGVEIDGSADVAGGNLTVLGDIDLSGMRFASVNAGSQLSASVLGSGEPGVLWLRAPGTLNVLGSVNDGFAPPPATPDDQGWVLGGGKLPDGQAIILPVSVTLGGGTVFPQDATLTYAIPLAAGTLAAGSVAPTQLTLAAPNARAFTSNVQIGQFAPGSLIPAGALPAGTIIPAGALLPQQIDFAAVTWPAGASLSLLASRPTLDPDAAPLVLAQGDLIPAGTRLHLIGANGKRTQGIDTRPDGMGRIWGVSQMLPAGDLSWSLRLVGGAELTGADSRAVQPADTLAQNATAADPAPGSVALSDLHVPNPKLNSTTVDFSVLRTGTGTLDILAGGNVSEATPFGIYTAGTQSDDIAAAYNQPRDSRNGNLVSPRGNLSLNGATYNTADAATYQANYPTGGGNLLISAGGSVTGDVYELAAAGGAITASSADSQPPAYSNDVGNWLWWQGGGAVPSAWWINFGTFASVAKLPTLVGFTGFGALGGGNVTVQAGGAAGQIAATRSPVSSTALDIAVGSTGRYDPATQSVALTGGGNLIAVAEGAMNAGAPLADAALSGNAFADDSLSGVLTDLRGEAFVAAASIGQVQLTYNDISALTSVNSPGSGVLIDPRPNDPLTSKTFDVGGGPVIVEGDTHAVLQTRGDLALAAIGNPTFGYQVQRPAQSSVFSLWQDTTSVQLASAGGNIVPATPYGASLGVNDAVTQPGTGNNVALLLYPPTLEVHAESGSIFVQQDDQGVGGLELAPAPQGQLEFLAGRSIYDVGNLSPVLYQAAIDISGAAIAAGDIPTPADPDTLRRKANAVNTGFGLFNFEPDVATGLLHAGDPAPARFYAVSGDIIGLQTGGLTFDETSQKNVLGDIAGKAVQIHAGRDVVSLGLSQQLAGLYSVPASGIFLNNNPGDISSIEAGNDIFFASALVAGPGLLLVQAGHDVYQGAQGFLESVGQTGQALTPATRNSGAGITVLAGVDGGMDEAAFADLYLNPANLADPNLSLQDQPGRVERTYQTQLLSFLQQRGYTGGQAGALDAFRALPPDQQTVFLLSVYFAELNRSGLDYNDPASRFYRSYLEGQQAIRTLFPDTDPAGVSPPSGGGLTAFSGTVFDTNKAPHTVDGGIRTDFGGAITTLVPYGTTLLGNYGITPGPLSGIVTQGSGDIDAYSYGSVILGQSRILTTLGGNILVWMSSDGEINAGRGSSSTVLAPPLSVSYDQFGNTLLSPTVPSSGAGIGTLAPIPSVPAGDLNLVAPFGTIDAGEAGIRASGNANIAALVVLNGANIAVGGKSTGIPTVTTANTSAAAAASAAAGSSTTAAQQTTPRAAPVQEPSVIEVEVVSITGGDTPDQRRRKRGAM